MKTGWSDHEPSHQLNPAAKSKTSRFRNRHSELLINWANKGGMSTGLSQKPGVHKETIIDLKDQSSKQNFAIITLVKTNQ